MAAALAQQKQSALGLVPPQRFQRRRHGRRTLRRFADFMDRGGQKAHDTCAQGKRGSGRGENEAIRGRTSP